MGKGLDHYISIVEQSHEKTASVRPAELNQNMLSKIANELLGTERGNMAGAPAAVVAADDGAAAALALAGLDAAQVAALEAAKPAPKAGQPVIGDTSGKTTSVETLNKDPMAAAEAAGDTAKVAELKRAQEIGDVMAQAFNASLEKQAFDREYREALEYVHANGALENYDVVDFGVEKSAAAAPESVSALEKIANNLELSRIDIINAAAEIFEMNKEAELADAAGREAAHEIVDELAKEAEADAEDEEDDAAIDAAAEAAAEELVEEEEGMKKKSEAPELEISEAVEVLKRHGVIK